MNTNEINATAITEVPPPPAAPVPTITMVEPNTAAEFVAGALLGVTAGLIGIAIVDWIMD